MSERALRIAVRALVVGVALLLVVVVNVDLALPAGAARWFRLAAGSILLTESIGLVVRTSPFRRALLQRFTAGSATHPSRLRRGAHRHAAGTALTVLGLAFLAAGVADVLRGAIG